MSEDHSFCSLPNSVAQDRNLSLKAKGLYHLIKSCMEDPKFDYDHFKPALQAKCKEGSVAFDSTWKELKRAGYLKQHRISRDDSVSKGFCYEYELLDTADDSTPSLETLKDQGKSIPPEHLVLGRTE